METVGNVAGPLLAYEVLTAFFLEAGFLGIMLFGARRVPGWLHTLATVLVAVGTTLSAFWIIVLNSWMQTPAGHEIRDGSFMRSMDGDRIQPLDALSPDPYAAGLRPDRGLPHRGAFGYRWLRGDRSASVRLSLRTGLTLAAVLIPIQIFVGDSHGLNTLQYQPQKVAAMEGNWETGPSKPLLLFAIPDEASGGTCTKCRSPMAPRSS